MIKRLKVGLKKLENIVFLHLLVLATLTVPVIYFHNQFAGAGVVLALLCWVALLITKGLLTNKLDRWPYWLILAGPVGLMIFGNCLLMDVSLREQDFQPAVIQHHNGRLDFLYKRFQPIGIVPLPGLTKVSYLPLRSTVTSSCPWSVMDMTGQEYRLEVSTSLKIMASPEAVRRVYFYKEVLGKNIFQYLVRSIICASVTKIFTDYPITFGAETSITLSSSVAKEVLRENGLDEKLESLGVLNDGLITITDITRNYF